MKEYILALAYKKTGLPTKYYVQILHEEKKVDVNGVHCSIRKAIGFTPDKYKAYRFNTFDEAIEYRDKLEKPDNLIPKQPEATFAIVEIEEERVI